jgi:hypothetical protein
MTTSGGCYDSWPDMSRAQESGFSVLPMLRELNRSSGPELCLRGLLSFVLCRSFDDRSNGQGCGSMSDGTLWSLPRQLGFAPLQASHANRFALPSTHTVDLTRALYFRWDYWARNCLVRLGAERPVRVLALPT